MMSSSKYLSYSGILMSNHTHTKESLEFARNLTVEDTDIFIVTYPKSGTIWTKEILSLVLSEGDMTPILTIPNYDRAPWLGMRRFVEMFPQLKAPRTITTHFPSNLMPASFYQSKAKVIYVMRNPKDVVVSFYHFCQKANYLEDPGTFEEFIDTFLNGRVIFGKWTDHVKSWKTLKLGDRILYITYEEMKEDLPAVVRKMSSFLEKNLSEEVIQMIAAHCTFEAMKDNPMSNYKGIGLSEMFADKDESLMLRKGITGDWKSHFTPGQLSRFTSVLKKEMEGETLPWSLEGVEEPEK